MEITVEVREHLFEMFDRDEKRFAREIYEAGVRWFEEGLLSQGHAATLVPKGKPN